ncbi:UNKNOWN [Stylonychia lemnae]|uniref:Succinate dehydrogenase assembly factor 3 n=1 Tax=Stylonychia lemnae TaxID=5949 RepID=A0A078A1T5_STYLE|nr:UNKNOWN [Stylonychia lemnae]|eukprot:CDW76080.1 UNKNOWN [Stylonychia lemnae]
MATFTMEKGQLALRLYRRIMKLHIRDLYVKQEFRLHLDKATDDQMDKFLVGWNAYADQIKQVNRNKPQELKKQLHNQEFDEMFKDKFTEEQTSTLKEFKDLIYESEKKKKDRSSAAQV